jgi:hypothetical protein
MKQFTDFEVKEMPMEDYLARPEYDNHRIGTALKSLKRLKWDMEHTNTSAITKSLRLGTLIHMAILEPEKFNQFVRVLPEGNKTTVEWKKAVVEQYSELELKSTLKPNELESAIKEAYPDLELVANDEYLLCMGLKKSAYTHLGSLLNREKMTEFVILCTHIETGLRVKIRPDLWIPSLGYGIDIKTTTDASPSEFIKDIYKYKYYRSFALYSDVLKDMYGLKKYSIWAQEKEPPYEYAFYEVDEELFLTGRLQYIEGLKKIAKAEETGNWHSYLNEEGKPIFKVI